MMGPAHVDICRRGQSLYTIRRSTGSQWSSLRVFVEIETRSNLRNFKTSRAAAFKTDCRGRMRNVAHQYLCDYVTILFTVYYIQQHSFFPWSSINEVNRVIVIEKMAKSV